MIVRSPGAWELLLPSGERVAVTKRSVLLGRKPTSDDSNEQCIAIDDQGRTVSKNHARLQWNGTSWQITDLESTNGVSTFADDGTETALAPGSTLPVNLRFLLGDAALSVSRPRA
nr:FHA domain-containing protein [Microbacterium halimionae]